MVNKMFLLLCVMFFVLFISTANADEGDLGIGANFGGVGLVGSGMGNYGSNGFGYGGYLAYAPSSLFDLDMDFVYSPHSSGANSANAFYGTLGLKFGMTFDQLRPFLTGGVGFYRDAVTISGVSDSAASFGFNFGGGMDIDLGKYLRIGLLVRYHPVLGKSLSSGAPGIDDFWDALVKIGFLFRTDVQGGWN